jgi:uncharacterized protein (TIRG00374 family)
VKVKAVNLFQFVFFLAIGGVLLYFAFRGIDLNELIVTLRHAGYGWVALSLVFAFLALLFHAYRWQLLLGVIDKHPRVSRILLAVNVGYLANFVFPRIGEITRCGVLNRTDKLPVDKVFGTVVAERMCDMLMALLLLALVLALKFETASGFMMRNVIYPMKRMVPETAGILWGAAILLLAAAAFFLLWHIFQKQLLQIKALRKIKEWLAGVFQGIKSILKLNRFGLFLLLNLLVYGMYFMQTYLMFFALPHTASLGMADALFILVVSSLSFVVPVQGGIGAYHVMTSVGLTVFGLSREEGMAYATLSHSATSLLLILLGALSLLILYTGKFTKPQ